MRLHGHIFEEKLVQLNIDEAFDLIQIHCKSAYASYQRGKFMFRGSNDANGSEGAKYYGGRKGRKSANTLNYYTILLDSDPRWKKYPKRSESFICTTDQYYAENFGDIQYVFPKDGFTIGVCPYEDFWASFDKSMPGEWRGQLGDMMYNIESLAEDVGVVNTGAKNYKDLVRLFKEIDKGWALKDDAYRAYLKTNNSFMTKYNGDFMKIFKDIFDPKANGFKTVKSIDKLPRDVECWVSGPVYMVSKDRMDLRAEMEETDMMS